MTRGGFKPIIAGAAFAGLTSFSAQAVEIEYWQYTFDARVKAIDTLIENFQKANPDITIKHTHFPYADYRKKVSVAIPAGDGPDLVQLYYGWLHDFRRAKLLQALPQEAFPHDKIESDFFPMVATMKADGEYWGLPTAVRSLALFYNKKLFDEAGIDGPPKTLDEFVETAKKLTKTDSAGNYTTVGYAYDTDGQDHHWWREVLTRLYGGAPYSDDGAKISYSDEAGEKALGFYTDLATKHKVGDNGFMNRGQDAFKAGRAGMIIDGSFRISTFDKQRGLEYAIDELPGHDGKKANFSSYWVNGITTKAEGEKQAAAVKFLQYLTSDEAMQIWLDTVGELPAKPAIALVDKNKNHEKFGPFIRGLEYAEATNFVSEKAQRQVVIDASDMITLQNTSVKDALMRAAESEQKVLDEFYSSN